MTQKLFSTFILPMLLFLFACLAISPTAHAATVTWDGETDSSFSTATNWVGDVAPINGDDVAFNTDAIIDFDSNVSLIGITVTGGSDVIFDGAGTMTLSTNISSSGGSSLILLNDNDIVLGGVMTVNTDTTSAIGLGSDYITTHNGLSGTDQITVTGTGALFLNAGTSYSGNIVANGGLLVSTGNNGLGDATGTTQINNGASLAIVAADVLNIANVSVAENISFAGLPYVSASETLSESAKLEGVLKGATCASVADEGYGACATENTVTLTGNITLTANLPVGVNDASLTLSGALSGGFNISVITGSAGNLIINGSSNTTNTANQTLVPARQLQTITDSNANSVYIGSNTTLTINGTRGNVYIEAGGVLKGTGTVGALQFLGGTLAPGESPGCLSSGNLTFSSGSNFEVEIEGTTACTQYDQQQVTGTVDLNDATLDIQRLSTFTPAINDAFIIVANDGADAVTGTFLGLAEGESVVVAGVTYQISYEGGDGNDVVLTVIDISGVPVDPDAPDTGFTLVTSQPATVFAIATLSAISLLAIARKSHA